MIGDKPWYGPDLARVHHLGFEGHADACAPGVLALLEPVRARGGLVLELGCGSGALTRHLVGAGHRVVATDASPAMLQLAGAAVPGAAEIRDLVLPDDPLPPADAVVSVGHLLNYLPNEAAIERGLRAIASALAPGGVVVLDLCDPRWAQLRRDQDSTGRVGEDWAVLTRFSTPAPTRYVREITTFLRDGSGGWRRSDERHENVLVEVAVALRSLSEEGVEAVPHEALGAYRLPDGMTALVGTRRR